MAEEGDVTSYNINPTSFGSVLGRVNRFSGKENIKRFMREFETRANAEAWSDNQKAAILKCACTGAAASFLEDRPETEYDDIVNALVERFHHKITKHEAYSRLSNVKQGNLSVSDYAHSVEETATALWEVADEYGEVASRDSVLISVFINGLNSDLRNMLVLLDFNRFTECISMATRAEQACKNTGKNRSSVQTVESHGNGSNSGQYHRSLPNKFSEKSSKQSRQKQKSEARRPEEVICYRCRNKGHFAKGCPYNWESVRQSLPKEGQFQFRSSNDSYNSGNKGKVPFQRKNFNNETDNPKEVREIQKN